MKLFKIWNLTSFCEEETYSLKSGVIYCDLKSGFFLQLFPKSFVGQTGLHTFFTNTSIPSFESKLCRRRRKSWTRVQLLVVLQFETRIPRWMWLQLKWQIQCKLKTSLWVHDPEWLRCPVYSRTKSKRRGRQGKQSRRLRQPSRQFHRLEQEYHCLVLQQNNQIWVLFPLMAMVIDLEQDCLTLIWPSLYSMMSWKAR